VERSGPLRSQDETRRRNCASGLSGSMSAYVAGCSWRGRTPPSSSMRFTRALCFRSSPASCASARSQVRHQCLARLLCVPRVFHPQAPFGFKLVRPCTPSEREGGPRERARIGPNQHARRTTKPPAGMFFFTTQDGQVPEKRGARRCGTHYQLPNSLSISPRLALSTGWGGRGSAQGRQLHPARIRWRRCSRRQR
jgi:hypothetical protein